MPTKRDLDKENMFRKIMPTAAAAQDAAKSGGFDAQTSEDPLPVQEKVPEPSSGGGKLDQDAVAALFAQAAQGDAEPAENAEADTAQISNEPSPVQEKAPEPSSSSGKLDQDAVAALFAQAAQGDAEPAENAEADTAQISNDPPPVQEKAPEPSSSGGKLDQDAVAALFAQAAQGDAEPTENAEADTAQASNDPPPVQEKAPEPSSSGGKLDQDAVAALFAQAAQGDAEPTENAEADTAQASNEPPPVQEKAPEPSSSGGKLDQDAVAALFAQAAQGDAEPAENNAEADTAQISNDPPPVQEKAPEPSSSGGKLDQDAVAALFAQAAQGDAEPTETAEADTAQTSNEPPPLQEKAPEPSSSGGKLDQDAVAALFAQAAQGDAEPTDTSETDTAQVSNEPPPASLQDQAPILIFNDSDVPQDSPHPVNLSEILMKQYYPRYVKRFHACECERCHDDACGLALNRIPPHYVLSTEINPEDLKDRKLIVEVVTALIKAISLVKRNPHHPIEESIFSN